MKTLGYTTIGSVRGCCDHIHRSLGTALACLKKDGLSASYQGTGCYSDREVLAVTHDRRNSHPLEKIKFDTRELNETERRDLSSCFYVGLDEEEREGLSSFQG